VSIYLRRLVALLRRTAQHAEHQPLPQGEAYVRLDELLGVPAELFPPAYRLSARQTVRLVRSLSGLLGAYRIYADLPPTLPVSRQYELLVGRLGATEIAYYGALGTWLEFCSYEPAACAFTDAHCSCRALVEEPAVGYAGAPASVDHVDRTV
jgi:hypothetical protein